VSFGSVWTNRIADVIVRPDRQDFDGAGHENVGQVKAGTGPQEEKSKYQDISMTKRAKIAKK
jgi:hypothetical protein